MKHWCENENNVYIARNGVVLIDKKRFPSGKQSVWVNPFDITLQKSLKLYYDYIVPKIESGELLEELAKLKGKTLGCWCVGDKIVELRDEKEWQCHGDVLLYLIDKYII